MANGDNNNTSGDSLFSRHSNNDSDDDDDSDHFLSPFASLRHLNQQQQQQQQQSNSMTPTPQDCYYYPKKQGATQRNNNTNSNVPSMFQDDDDDEEANSATLPYHIALNRSMEQQEQNDTVVVNERSSLLGNNKGRKRALYKHASTPIHPLWDHDDEDDDDSTKKGKSDCCNSRIRNWVVWLSFLHLSCMTLHDGFLWYVSYRQGREANTSMSWPWGAPSPSTLQQFGAYVPYDVLELGHYWRFLSCTFITTSWMEWILIATSWYYAIQQPHMNTNSNHASQTPLKDNKNTKKQQQGTTTMIWFLYFGSILAGLLFLTAWGRNGRIAIGGASLGTSGILAAQVMNTTSPRKRQRALLAILLLLCLLALNVTLPNNTVWAGSGATVFGCVCGIVRNKRQNSAKWLSVLLLLSLWIAPVLWIGYMQ